MAILINKRDIIFEIQKTEKFVNPKIELEQYNIDAASAVDIIFFAGFEFNDINQKIIVDLGAGTGILSITSAFFEPSIIVSVDIDIDALIVLKRNLKHFKLQNTVLPICADVGHFEISDKIFSQNLKITTIMNPPFGVKKRKADRVFLEKAFLFSDVVYSIHLTNKNVHKFITRFIHKFNWKIDYMFPFNMMLEKSFPFHSQKTKKIGVTVYRFVKNS
ncbi:MAG: METTL5 family protein [Candidatus Hermodarchaeota archaeon]